VEGEICVRQRVLCLLVCMMCLIGCKTTVQTNNAEPANSKEETKDTNEIKSTNNSKIIEELIDSEQADNSKEVTKEDSMVASNNQKEELEMEDETVTNEQAVKKYNLPGGFVYVDDVIPTVELDIRYYTEYNFVGEKIDGYVAPLAILTTEAANALKMAADRLAEDGYHIKIYDAYRPQKAVNHFVRWSQGEDAAMKQTFYPSMEKAVLFTDGYISNKSRHSRGSTVDLTIVDDNGGEIDMGGYFDMLDTISNYDTNQITDKQHENREYLRSIMEEAGYDSIRTEWWHFQLREEPYKDTYFDFDIE
jgi:zinc D-Ala-D-Ala dipeptidase